MAAINSHLFGSPLTSGYGSFSQNFDPSRIGPNALRYFSWFEFAHTPAALVGFVPLILPLKRFWPNVGDRRIFVIIALFVSLLLLEFLAYLVFDHGGYLRFVIPCLPFIMIGVGAVVSAIAQRARWLAVGAMLLIGMLAVRDFRVAVDESFFNLWQGDVRYVAAATLVRRLTDPSSVIYSMQHSGSLRYYGGRLTVRYDLIDRRLARPEPRVVRVARRASVSAGRRGGDGGSQEALRRHAFARDAGHAAAHDIRRHHEDLPV